MMVVVTIGGGWVRWVFPAMLTAIATGHVALVIAKRFSRRAARRWMAIVGLIVGYLSLLAFCGVIAVFVIASNERVLMARCEVSSRHARLDTLAMGEHAQGGHAMFYEGFVHLLNNFLDFILSPSDQPRNSSYLR